LFEQKLEDIVVLRIVNGSDLFCIFVASMDESALEPGKDIMSKVKETRKTRRFDNPILAHPANHIETRRLPPPPPPPSSASPSATRPVSTSSWSRSAAAVSLDSDEEDAGTFDDIYSASNK
jgi:hypothetical protein